MKKIELDAPYVAELEKEYLCKCIDSGFVSTFGPFVFEFEKRVASYLGAENSVAVQSGTAALYMALHELGIGPGDEVIVPALTFVATINPIIYVGATPVIVDVDIDTWNINPVKIKEAITDKTKAVIPVHLYGNPCNIEEILDIAKKYNLYIIEDATESLGSKINGKYTGVFGNFGCFSFNGNKIITTGGGGMIVGQDARRIDHIRFLINQAKGKTSSQHHSEVGFNYRMTNIEAALGLAQMESLNKFLERKMKFNDIYKEELRGVSSISFQKEQGDSESNHWFTTIAFEDRVNIPALQDKLAERGVLTRRVFRPIIDYLPYKNYINDHCKVSYQIYERGLCLASSVLNTDDSIRYACKIIRKEIKRV